MSENNEPIIHPKLLLQFYKGQTVPKLVSKHERQNTSPLHYERLPKSRQRRQKSTHSVNSIQSKRTVENKHPQSQLQDLNRMLQSERFQNAQLRQIIKQLTTKADRLKDVNEDLLIRIKEVQNVYEQFSKNYGYEKRQQDNKTKLRVYHEIQNYIKKVVEKFTDNLSNDKMTPIIQKKIQVFLEQLLQINPISVEHEQKRIKNQLIKFNNDEVNETINNMLEKQSKSKYRMGESRLQKSNYDNVFRQLSKLDASRSHINQNTGEQNFLLQDRSRSGERAGDLKNYGTPQRTSKRPKIFSKKYITQGKNVGFFRSDLQL